MSAIHDLIAQISDPRLRQRLAVEWANASKEKKFGLVFEDHLPELLPLHGAKPRDGDLVCRRDGVLKDVLQVRMIQAGIANCIKPADSSETESLESVEQVRIPLDELLVVREFGEPIFPALIPFDEVTNGPENAPWHALIEADNYHALQLLEYLYAGQVDCIYIDPPYNTGARDWKYNNDYVDINDGWRHSKWLAFMDKRLRLAKRLLKQDGLLIITIDDNELPHLLMLSQQILPAHKSSVVSIQHNPGGTQGKSFSVTNEYAIFIYSETTIICKRPHHGGEMYNLRRWGSTSGRYEGATCFYPIYVDKDGEIKGFGDLVDDDFHPISQVVEQPDGLLQVWPLDKNGVEKKWRYARSTIDSIRDRLIAKKTGSRVEIKIRREDEKPKTIWTDSTYNAEVHGTDLLKNVIGGGFNYPKSIYAVKDCIALGVLNKPNALVLDFFAGSGTTLNAVNLLNSTDKGHRRCILITNNEVSAEEASSLSARGLKPGDDEWEAHGICRTVTWPRGKHTILGQRDDGSLLEGEYLTGRAIAVDKPRKFIQIGFIGASELETRSKKKQVVALIDGLPQTLVKDVCPFIVSDKHKATVLFDFAAAEEWLSALDGQEHISDFYIVTPIKRVFEQLKSRVSELLGPIIVSEEERRPMSLGFPANLAYLKLEFLDRGQVSLRRAFREILPLLWLKAGAVGPQPELKSNEPEPVLFAPKGNNFVVLLDETRMGRLLKFLESHSGLSYVFIVTDADESFKTMANEVREAAMQVSPDLQVVQLYRDYLLNFMINKNQDRAAVHKDTLGPHK